MKRGLIVDMKLVLLLPTLVAGLLIMASTLLQKPLKILSAKAQKSHFESQMRILYHSKSGYFSAPVLYVWFDGSKEETG